MEIINYKGEDRCLFVTKHARDPYLWKHIRLVAKGTEPEDGTTVFKNTDCMGKFYCKSCNKFENYTIGNSNTLRRHVQNNPANHKQEDEAQSNKKRKLDDFFPQTVQDAYKRLGQATMANNNEFRNILARWVCESQRPLVVVEDKGLEEAIRYANGCNRRLVVPGRTSLTEEVEALVSKLRLKLKELLKEECMWYSLTTDIWTSSNNKSYISLTLHYVTEDFVMKSWTLDVKEFQGRHTGMNIKTKLEGMMEFWGLAKPLLSIFLRDNASNGTKAMQEMKVKHMGCIAHSINLVICALLFGKLEKQDENYDETSEEQFQEFQDGLGGDNTALIKEVRKRIAKIRSLIKYFAKSPTAKDKLDGILKELCGMANGMGVSVDCKTRWNSCCTMCETFVNLKAAFYYYYSFIEGPDGKDYRADAVMKNKPDQEDFCFADGMILLLRPFLVATELLSGETYPTLMMTLPVLRDMKKKLSERNVTQTVDQVMAKHTILDRQLRNLLIRVGTYLRETFVKRFDDLTEELLWTTVLNPLFVKLKHLSDDEKL